MIFSVAENRFRNFTGKIKLPYLARWRTPLPSKSCHTPGLPPFSPPLKYRIQAQNMRHCPRPSWLALH